MSRFIWACLLFIGEAPFSRTYAAETMAKAPPKQQVRKPLCSPESWAKLRATADVKPFTADGTYHTDYDIIINLPFYREASDLHVKWINEIRAKDPLVLEAGGGTGNMTAAAIRARPDADIHLLDLNEAMTRFAPAKGIRPENIHITDITNMVINGAALSANTVDHIFSHSVLWGLPEPDAFYREAHRVLKAEGTLAVSTIIPFDAVSEQGFLNYLEQHLFAAAKEGRITEAQAKNFVDNNRKLTQVVKHKFSKEGLVRIGEENGFATVEIQPAYVVETPRGKEPFFWQILYRKKVDPIEKHFSRKKIQSPEQVQAVMDAVFAPSAEQRMALQSAFGADGKLKPLIWNRYFDVYSQITWASSGYQDIIRKASEALPNNGTILDVGSGTGNFIEGLHQQSSTRKFIAIDNSDRGLEITRNRAKDQTISVEIRKGNIISSELKNLMAPDQRIDAALMNNVLYTVKGRKAKLKVLQSVYNALPPGAVFFINDPNVSVASEAGMRDFVTKVGMDMRGSGNSITEYDLALFAEVNRRFLATAVQQGKVPLSDLVKSAGFEIISSGSTYYGHCDYLVLRKP